MKSALRSSPLSHRCCIAKSQRIAAFLQKAEALKEPDITLRSPCHFERWHRADMYHTVLWSQRNGVEKSPCRMAPDEMADIKNKKGPILRAIAQLLPEEGASQFDTYRSTIIFPKQKSCRSLKSGRIFIVFLFLSQDYFFREASCFFSCSFSCSSLACFCSRFLISFMISETVPSEGRDTWPPWPILLV